MFEAEMAQRFDSSSVVTLDMVLDSYSGPYNQYYEDYSWPWLPEENRLLQHNSNSESDYQYMDFSRPLLPPPRENLLTQLNSNSEPDKQHQTVGLSENRTAFSHPQLSKQLNSNSEPNKQYKTVDLSENRTALTHPQPSDHFDSRVRYKTIKRGLSGFLNDNRVSAIADTGSGQNVISFAYVSRIKVEIDFTSSTFLLGNSATIQSIGIVKLPWAFAEDPTKTYDLLFHVLKTFIYDVILGNSFLTATQTLSKYGRRLTECVFFVARVFRFGFLGNECQRLEGIPGDEYTILAVPDTGAERNVMDARYAKTRGFHIDTGSGTRLVLQFADGSLQETVGQVTAYWTFASGQKALLTFEVLEDCASDVIVGEDFIYSHNIFQEHEASLLMLSSADIDSYKLATIDVYKPWQKKFRHIKLKFQGKEIPKVLTPPLSSVSSDEQNERERRDIWNHKYNFGDKATAGEKQAEIMRRQEYKENRNRVALDQSSGHDPRIPSIPTASLRVSLIDSGPR